MSKKKERRCRGGMYGGGAGMGWYGCGEEGDGEVLGIAGLSSDEILSGRDSRSKRDGRRV